MSKSIIELLKTEDGRRIRRSIVEPMKCFVLESEAYTQNVTPRDQRLVTHKITFSYETWINNELFISNDKCIADSRNIVTKQLIVDLYGNALREIENFIFLLHSEGMTLPEKAYAKLREVKKILLKGEL